MSIITFFPERAVALTLFGFQIHWYGVMYALGFLITWKLLPYLRKYRSLQLSKDDWVYVLTMGVLGVLVGGRLGYVLFYMPAFYIQHPSEIVVIWHGGMSSHGGMLGVGLALWYACKKLHCNFLALTDIAVVPAAIGLALGRVGNFINQELYGTATNLPWGIRIDGVEGLRHPVQWYAVAKDLSIATACYLLLKKSTYKTGQVTALFLILYGVLRFIVEYFRYQEWPILFGFLTRGQLLTIPFFIFGIWLYWSKGHEK